MSQAARLRSRPLVLTAGHGGLSGAPDCSSPLPPRRRTFNYILKELPKVPTHVPVCVLGNYRDMGEHRVVLPDDMREFIDSLNR